MPTLEAKDRISTDTLNAIRDMANDKIDLILSSLGFDIDNMINCGDEIRTKCPLHNGNNPTSFSYSIKYKRWRCYSSGCHEDKDNIFGLIMATKGIGFRESVEWLSSLLDITIDKSNKVINDYEIEINKQISQYKIKQSLKQKLDPNNSNGKMNPFPIHNIDGKIQPPQYFLDKGFSEGTLRKYNVGYCDNPRKPMYLRSYAPVLDERGKLVIGVTGRIIYEKCELCGAHHEISNKGCPVDNPNVKSYPKWFHYGFNTGNTLYNSWFANKYVQESGVAILTEGPKEVWWFEQHNIHNSMCIFGLNVFKYQIDRLIKMGATTLVVALDNDERGLEASEKLNDTIGMYFKLVNIKRLLNQEADIDDINSERMQNVILPFIQSLHK